MSESHDFFKLERRIQDRLVASVRREASPVMLARAKLPSRGPLVASALVVALALGVTLVVVGLGQVPSPVFRHPPPVVLAHAAWLTALGVALLVLRRKRRSARALPFPLGRYLFSSGVLEVMPEALRFHPLEGHEVTPLAAPTAYALTARVARGSFRFEVAEAEVHAVRAELEGYAAAKARGASDLIEEASPLHLPRYLSPIAPVAPYAFEPTFAERRPLLATLVWAAPFAGMLFMGREVASDELAFRDAKKRDNVSTYAAYVARGRAHVRAVERTFLPRAALRDAKAAGTVEAIEAFRAKHPTTDIEPEIAAARAQAVHDELGRAVGKGELAALGDHARRFPTEAKAERDAAIAVHFARERDRLLMGVPAHDPTKLGAALRALYQAPQTSPPPLTLEARSETGPGLELAERAVQRTITWNGKKSLPSAMLTEKVLTGRARAEGLVARDLLRRALESDALPFSDREPTKGTKGPRLVVTRRVDGSGRVFTSMKPRVAVAGLNVSYDVSLVLPSGATAWTWKTTVSEGVHAAQIKKEGEGVLEERLYREMQDAADKTFAARLRAVLEPKGLHASR